MLIGSAAYFQPCHNCGEHGHIVFANGISSPEVASKQMAMFVADEAHRIGLVAQVELPELMRQIEASKLARHDEDACSAAQLAADGSNLEVLLEMLRTGPQPEDSSRPRVH